MQRPGEIRDRRSTSGALIKVLVVSECDGALHGELSVLQGLRRLLLQGALRVVLVVITTAGVVGFLSLIPRNSQSQAQTFADAKKASGAACLPSQCRTKTEAAPRNDRR
jgi:hypothetical protein